MATIRNFPLVKIKNKYVLHENDILLFVSYNSIADFTKKGVSFKLNVLSNLVYNSLFIQAIRRDLFMYLGTFKFSLGQDIISMVVPAMAFAEDIKEGDPVEIIFYYTDKESKKQSVHLQNYVISNKGAFLESYLNIKLVPEWIYTLMKTYDNLIINDKLYLDMALSQLIGKNVIFTEDSKEDILISNNSFITYKNSNKFQLISNLLSLVNPSFVLFEPDPDKLTLALSKKKENFKTFNYIFNAIDKSRANSIDMFQSYLKNKYFVQISTAPMYLDDLSCLTLAYVPISPITLNVGQIMAVITENHKEIENYLVIKRLHYFDQTEVFKPVKGSERRLRAQHTFVLLYKL